MDKKLVAKVKGDLKYWRTMSIRAKQAKDLELLNTAKYYIGLCEFKLERYKK